MADFSTDRLEPTARGTPVATHTEPQYSKAPRASRKKPERPNPSSDNSDLLERGEEERVRQIDQMA
jgi:hypothetical protein